MAVQATSEILIEASIEQILDALADSRSLPSWSSVHKCAEVIDTHPDGRPHHVKVTLKVIGIGETELLEYHWGPDWMVWDAKQTAHQHSQHGEYNLSREGDGKTRVRLTITIEPVVPLPEFLVSRARNKILNAGLEGLRARVMGA